MSTEEDPRKPAPGDKGYFIHNSVIIVFGASGDLAKKKTFPALFSLFFHGLLPDNARIVGYARSKLSHEEFLDRITSKLPKIEEKIAEFKKICTYVSGQYDTDEGYVALRKHAEELEEPWLTESGVKRNRLFYLALPPSVFGEVSAQIKKIVHPGPEGNARIIIEKPFGRDLETSRELQKEVAPNWTEEEVYRIDHYLGKDMVKNLTIIRFTNQFITAGWNKENIASIQISFKEPFGTEGRGGYFDDIGIIRDVMQNHLLQVLTLIGMERPVDFGPEEIRDEKVKLLKAIKPIDIKNVILGQYDKSEDGTKPSYLDDETVHEGSKAVTFAAMQVEINNDRWQGVPIILRAGKALDEGKVEIRIQFKDVPSIGNPADNVSRNELVIRVQPREAIYLKLNAKFPGMNQKTVVTDLDLTYSRRYSDIIIPEAYESLILDCLKGNHSNFVRDDELDVSWKIFTPLLHYIEQNPDKINLEKYAYGSRGPKSLPEFLAKRGYVRNTDEKYNWPVMSKNNL